MSIAPSRRLFLFGSAAALAAPAIAKIVPAPMLAPFQLPAIAKRYISGLLFEADSNVASLIEVGVRGADRPGLAYAVGAGGCLNWSVAPRDEFALAPHDVLQVSVTPIGKGDDIRYAKAHIIYYIGGKGFVEEFGFPSGYRNTWPLDASPQDAENSA
jgi:hypothetical protein